MKNEKLYFKTIEDTTCHNLQYFLYEAAEDGFSTTTLLEAIPDTETKDYVWCSELGEVTQIQECCKSNCEFYFTKTGKGICNSRGKLYLHGKPIMFDVETGTQIH